MSGVVLRQSAGTAHSRILAIGGARGDDVVTNDDLAGPIDSSDEWIRQRTGIVTRRSTARTRAISSRWLNGFVT